MPADEIVVTEAMRKAGALVIARWSLAYDSAEDAAEEVFNVMLSVKRMDVQVFVDSSRPSAQ